MIRLGAHKGKEYITVSTSIRLDKQTGNISVPVIIQVDVSKLADEDRIAIFKRADKAFNHIMVIKDEVKVPPTPTRKHWWNRYLGR